MKFLFVVYILMNGVWIRGDDIDGWASMPHATMEACIAQKARADALQADLMQKSPTSHPKRFACEPMGPKKRR
jgi:hypothetical protein